MDSDGSYHSESEFYYPDEVTNENQKKKKKNFGAIGNEENQQNADVFMLANVQNYILAQLVENTVKKTEYDQPRSQGFSPAEKSPGNEVGVRLERLEESFFR